MVTENKLKIGNHEAIMIALRPKEREYESVDRSGNKLIYVSGKVERGYHTDAEGNKVIDVCKLIGGKPIPKLLKTKEIKPEKVEMVPIHQVDNLITEKEYLIDCDSILQELNNEKSGSAYSFKYSTGNGHAVYRALVYPDKVFKGYARMKLGTTRVSEIISELEEVRANKEKLKSISLSLQELPKATVDDIEIDI